MKSKDARGFGRAMSATFTHLSLQSVEPPNLYIGTHEPILHGHSRPAPMAAPMLQPSGSGSIPRKLRVDQLNGPLPPSGAARGNDARRITPQPLVPRTSSTSEPKDRLLKRLVKFAKGGDSEEHELSSYASYDKVAKGVRKLSTAVLTDEAGKDHTDKFHHSTLISPNRLPVTARK